MRNEIQMEYKQVKLKKKHVYFYILKEIEIIFPQLGGLIVTGLGIWTIVDRSFTNELLGSNLYVGSAYVLIITGLLVLLISCLGCLGSIKEVRCMLVIVSDRNSSTKTTFIKLNYFLVLHFTVSDIRNDAG